MRAVALHSVFDRLRDLKIAHKLMLGFGIVLLLSLIQGVFAYRGLASLDGAANQITASMHSVKSATMLRALVGDYRTQEYRLLMKASDAVKAEAREALENLNEEIVALEDGLLENAANDEERAAVAALAESWKTFHETSVMVRELIDLELEDDAIDTHLGEAHDKYAVVVGQLDTLVDLNSGSADMAAESAQRAYAGANGLIVLIVLVSIAAGLTLAWLVARITSRGVQDAVRVAKEVAAGKLDGQIAIASRDELGELMSAMQTMQRDLRERIENDRRIAGENLRIRNALDKSSTSVMIADLSHRIIYANESVRAQLEWQLDELRKAYPDFSTEKLVGSSIHLFHKNADRISQVLDGLDGVHKAQVRVGNATFAQTISPVLDASGERLGYVVEWRDRTAEIAVEGEVAGVISAASAGNLDERIPVKGKQGFFLQLAEGINAMLETNKASIGEVQRVLAALARGDLTQKIDADFQGVFGQMKDDANATVDQLTAIVGGIKETTDAINVAAREIASGNADLSSRTEQQAASLEETASSMEELTSTVQQNADNARQANKLAIGASEVAVKGGEVVGNVVTTMDAIHASSKKIFDIISVIDGIAFQTNILALNAAVEAARAGEQGRGFAVVAAEVRSLAQRSAEAAKEIKALIGDSVSKVGVGTKLVDEAGKTMNEIVESVKRVTGIMADIAAASDEQSAGIQQVSQTVTHMDEVTQQNAALVEEATAAARSLEEQAEGLARAVAAFKMSDEHTHALSMQRQADIMVAAPARPKPAAPATAPRAMPTPPAKGNGKGRGRIDPEDQNWQEF